MVGGIFRGRFVEAEEDVLRVDQGDDAVEIDGTTKAIVEPEKGGEISRVRETAGLENNIIKGAAARDERFDGCYPGVSGVTCA